MRHSATARRPLTIAGNSFLPEQLEPRTLFSSTLPPSFAPMHNVSTSTVVVAPLDPGPTLRSLVASSPHASPAAAPARLVQPGADLTQRPEAPPVDTQRPHDPESSSSTLRGFLLLLTAPADWEMDILIITPGRSTDPRGFMLPAGSPTFDGLTLSIAIFPKDKTVLYTIVLPPSDALPPGSSINLFVQVKPSAQHG